MRDTPGNIAQMSRRQWNRGLVLWCKRGTGPSGHVRCRGLRKPPVVGQVFYAADSRYCSGAKWERWRCCEIEEMMPGKPFYFLEQ
jgi:hypothetical protein